jgi:hypothetical protein
MYKWLFHMRCVVKMDRAEIALSWLAWKYHSKLPCLSWDTDYHEIFRGGIQSLQINVRT